MHDLKRTIYCDSCGDERLWPRSLIEVDGVCEVCGAQGLMRATPTSVLPKPPPAPKKPKNPNQLSFALEDIMRDRYWPDVCTLMGCENSTLRPHHHHYVGGHLTILACQCTHVDQPGTRPE